MTTPLATSSSNLIQVDPISGELSEFSGATLISDVNSIITTFTNTVTNQINSFMNGPTFNNATITSSAFNSGTISSATIYSPTIYGATISSSVIDNITSSSSTNSINLNDSIAGGAGEMSLCSSYVNLLNNNNEYTSASNFPIFMCQIDGNLLIEINDVQGAVLETSWQNNTLYSNFTLVINDNSQNFGQNFGNLPNMAGTGPIPPGTDQQTFVNNCANSNDNRMTSFFPYFGGDTDFWANTMNFGNEMLIVDTLKNLYIPRAYSIICGNRVLASAFDAYSDERIKNNITDIDNKNALDIIRKIQPKKYTYKDIINKGNKPEWGFIAQEVKSLIENSTNIVTEFIPDIYEVANILNSFSNTIKLDTKTTINFEINEKIRLIYKDGKYLDTKITGILDTYTFTIEENINQEQIFVYGREVHDLHTLDKDTIFTISTSALKEVDKELQNEKVLRQKLENLVENQGNDIKELYNIIQNQNKLIEKLYNKYN